MAKTTFTTVLAAVIVLASVPSAFAASPGDAVTCKAGETVTCKVSTVGLNLHSRQDARSMLRRIEMAAGVACGGEPQVGDLDATLKWQSCVSHRVNQAVAQLGSPLVSEANRQPMAAQTASNGR
jgi:UrcA family protein